jgi:hypothetical protein
MPAVHSYGRRLVSAKRRLLFVVGFGVEAQSAASSQNNAISVFVQSCIFILLASPRAVCPGQFRSIDTHTRMPYPTIVVRQAGFAPARELSLIRGPHPSPNRARLLVSPLPHYTDGAASIEQPRCHFLNSYSVACPCLTY